MPPDLARAGVLVLAGVLAAGCSRVTFLKPDVSRGSYRQVARDVDIRDESPQRTHALNLAQLARVRLGEGDVAAAHAAAADAVRRDPKLGEAHGVLALVLEAMGRRDDAGRHHRLATGLSPLNAGLANNYGTWLCASGQAQASLPLFERALKGPPGSAQDNALANLGACALRAGDAARAYPALMRAVSRNPSNPVALRALAQVEFDRGQPAQARALIERRLAVAPADVESLQLASQIEQALGDTAASARYVQRIRAEFPRTSDSAGGTP